MKSENAKLKTISKKISGDETGVTLKTDDSFLQRLYDAAECVCKQNLKDFCGSTVLIEGGGYNYIWPETQPMGGEMYAKRNLSAAFNNTLFFMEYQRSDGRFPGHISCDNNKIEPVYTHLQGFCFPFHALNLYYWDRKRDTDFLQMLYKTLEAYDSYLWKHRDSDKDGCLETWCAVDTGEDHCNRFAGTKLWWKWSGEISPSDDKIFPLESMDMMGYSYDARNTLSSISMLLDNGLSDIWRKKADAIKTKINEYLWDDARGACFDRDINNTPMRVLTQNNLRVMYHGAFTQEMAERFVREHLMNPEEFWTKMPLPSIAINDPTFRNVSENDWSGQSEGLTYQRAIRALENYGMLSELTQIGNKLIDCVGRYNTFPQQFDPFTGDFSEPDKRVDYGPTALSVLEYIARFHGIHLHLDQLYWGALGRKKYSVKYVQQWNDDRYEVLSDGNETIGRKNGYELFRVTNGLRVVTTWDGDVKTIINILPVSKVFTLNIRGREIQLKLEPNQQIGF